MTFVLRTSYGGWSAGTAIEVDRLHGNKVAAQPVTFPNGEEWAIDPADIVERRSRSDIVPLNNREARRKIKEASL